MQAGGSFQVGTPFFARRKIAFFGVDRAWQAMAPRVQVPPGRDVVRSSGMILQRAPPYSSPSLS